MRAIIYDGDIRFVSDYPTPKRKQNEALIRVLMAGICNTDLEIAKGYMGFRGVLGHEFVGWVEEADNPELLGKRVVGEINYGCGKCPYCLKGLKRHCPHRLVLGILGRDGAFAEYLTLPTGNLHILPDDIADEEAVFVEPLAASLEIKEQIQIRPTDRVAVLGDGKLGLLIGQILGLSGCQLLMVGKHEEKLSILGKRGTETCLIGDVKERDFDIVVEATGSEEGLRTAINLVRPQGMIVLKSTLTEESHLNTAPLVINEITVVGSRCGPFRPAISLLERKLVDVEPLISKIFALEDGVEAMDYASKGSVLKVILKVT